MIAISSKPLGRKSIKYSTSGDIARSFFSSVSYFLATAARYRAVNSVLLRFLVLTRPFSGPGYACK